MQAFKTIVSILLIIAGILSIVFGIVVLNKPEGSYGSYAKFEADFYTYINDNANRTADNTRYNNEIVKAGFGFILIISGLTISLVSLRSMICDIENKKIGQKSARDIEQTEAGEDKNKAKKINSDMEPKKVISANKGYIICPVCRNYQDEKNTACNKCGQPFIVEKPGESTQKLEPVRVVTDDDGSIQCPACKTVQRGNRSVCYKCGQPFIVDESNKN